MLALIAWGSSRGGKPLETLIFLVGLLHAFSRRKPEGPVWKRLSDLIIVGCVFGPIWLLLMLDIGRP